MKIRYKVSIIAILIIIVVGAIFVMQNVNFSSFILGVDEGSYSKNESSSGSQWYANKSLNLKFKVSNSWEGKMGIGGWYTLHPKNETEFVAIGIRKTEKERLENTLKTPKEINTLAELKENIEQHLQENVDKAQDIVMEEKNIANTPALSVQYAFGKNHEYIAEEIYILKNGFIYEIGYSSLAALHEKYQSEYTNIVNSLQLLK